MNFKISNYQLYYQVPVVAEPVDSRRDQPKEKRDCDSK